MAGDKEEEKKAEPKLAPPSVDAVLERVQQFFSTALEHSYNAAQQYGPRLERFEFITKPLEEAKAKADDALYSASEKLNTGLPAPIPSLLRSHSWQLVQTSSFATGLLFAYPVRKISGGGFLKTFVVAGAITGVAVGSLAELVKYKWSRGKN